MESPEQHQPSSEEQKPVEQKEEPVRSNGEVTADYDKQKETQKERDQQERPEHQKGEESAEENLDNEILLEKYEEMKNGLQGGAKEVFDSVNAELSNAEKIEFTQMLLQMRDALDDEREKAYKDIDELSQDKSGSQKNRQGETPLASILQEGIDDMIRDAQGQKKSDPQNENERLEEAIKVRVLHSFHEQNTDGRGVAADKIVYMAHKYIHTTRQKDPSHTFEAREGEATQSSGDPDLRSRTNGIASVYEGRNLMNEVKQANEKGMKIIITSEFNQELNYPGAIGMAREVRLDIVVPSDYNGNVKHAMKQNKRVKIIGESEDGLRLIVEGTPVDLLKGVQNIGYKSETVASETNTQDATTQGIEKSEKQQNRSSRPEGREDLATDKYHAALLIKQLEDARFLGFRVHVANQYGQKIEENPTDLAMATDIRLQIITPRSMTDNAVQKTLEQHGMTFVGKERNTLIFEGGLKEMEEGMYDVNFVLSLSTK